ncbi:hypothetical protein ASPFODRAFT_49180 [Aspergillus luchuensis CBS 106.47]|uniref:Uncharacterized protein n=1 Tax=Aspergillus luchuensis (strain CBS 106.47) TaxID=1137211 RepID=A0A1M3TAM7_ASPLC|nr:hypothetical protein ASPFODRAFT_49180 [Aspergillus luchuensis CBS 106.47]
MRRVTNPLDIRHHLFDLFLQGKIGNNPTTWRIKIKRFRPSRSLRKGVSHYERDKLLIEATCSTE